MARRVFSASILALVAACSSADERAPTSARGQPIINGKASDASQDYVVRLVVPLDASNAGTCTASLLAPNVVLTARHCVSRVSTEGFVCDEKGNVYSATGSGGKVYEDHDPAKMLVFVGSTRPYYDDPAKASARAAKIIHDGAKVLCGHDLAIVVLDRPIEGAPIGKIRIDAPPAAGETMTAVGWGVTSVTPQPMTRQQRSGIRVLRVGPFAGDDRSSPLPANDFEVGEGICSGDSGGPAIAESTGAIIGVVSRGGNGAQDPSSPSAGCEGTSTRNDYTQLAPFKDLILDAFAQAEAEAWVEGGPDPRLAKTGQACEGDDACRSGICLSTNGKRYCSQPCDPDPCGDGYECRPVRDAKACVMKTPPPAPSGCALSPASAIPPPAFGGSASAGSSAALVALAAALGLALGRRRPR